MGQLENFRFFVQIVDDGSVSAVARRLNIAKSAISRRLALLEHRYETRLIDRAPGVWSVTEAGQELYQRATQLLGDFDEIEADFVSVGAKLSGPLTVSVPRDFGLGFLNNALVAFKRKYPAIALSIDFDDRVVDLDRENYDFAIRITGDSINRFLTSRIGSTAHALYASKKYLHRTNVPRHVGDLRDHQLLHYGSARRASWQFFNADDSSQILNFRPFLNSNSGQFLLEAVRSGLGIGRLPDFILNHRRMGKDLVPVLPDVTSPKWGIYLVYSENRRLNRRMKLFLDEMKLACFPITQLPEL